MKTIQLSITIHAKKQIVWNALCKQLNSRRGVAAFVSATLEEGTYILRQIPAGDEILACIVRCSTCDIISMVYDAVIIGGEANYRHIETCQWMGLYEIYRLNEQEERTVLRVEADSPTAYATSALNQVSKTLHDIKLRSEQMAVSLTSN